MMPKSRALCRPGARGFSMEPAARASPGRSAAQNAAGMAGSADDPAAPDSPARSANSSSGTRPAYATRLSCRTPRCPGARHEMSFPPFPGHLG